MTNQRSKGGSGFLVALLVLIDLGLFVWIGASWYGQREPEKPEPETDGLYGGTQSYDPEPFSGADYGLEAEENPSAAVGGESAGGGDSWLLDPPDAGQSSDPAPAQTPDPVPAQTPDPVPAQTPEELPLDGASRFGSAGRPETGEFQTWYEQNIIGSVPDGARMLTDFREVTGEWKGLLRYETRDTGEVTASELVNFTVSGTASESRLLVDWYLISFAGDGEWSNEEDMEDTPYQGSWSDGSLAVTGPGSIRMTSFYEWEGAQFAVGEMDVPDGTAAVIGMIRP